VRSSDERLIKQSLLSQLGLALVLAAVMLAVGRVESLSALIGGLIAAAGNAVFAFWVFGPYRAQQAGKLAARLYGAELAKMTAIALAFIGVFLWVKPISAVALFGCFLAVHLVPAVVAARNRAG
jgi:ATP synthase protein I